MVYRSARASGAVTLVSDLAEMSGTGNKREAINPKSGKRSTAKLLTAGIRNGITGGGLGSGRRRDPRTICRTGDAFSGGIGSQGSRGYQQTGGSSGESRFDFGRLVKDVAVNSLIGGLAGAAFYGFDKAVGAVYDGIRGRGNNHEVKYRVGKPIEPMDKTYEMALNPELYAYEVAKKYGINLRGSSQNIDVSYNPFLVSAGKTTAEIPNVIELGPSAFVSEEELANTIAHELNHARSFFKGGSAPEWGQGGTYPSGNALAEYIRGNR